MHDNVLHNLAHLSKHNANFAHLAYCLLLPALLCEYRIPYSANRFQPKQIDYIRANEANVCNDIHVGIRLAYFTLSNVPTIYYIL